MFHLLINPQLFLCQAPSFVVLQLVDFSRNLCKIISPGGHRQTSSYMYSMLAKAKAVSALHSPRLKKKAASISDGFHYPKPLPPAVEWEIQPLYRHSCPPSTSTWMWNKDNSVARKENETNKKEKTPVKQVAAPQDIRTFQLPQNQILLFSKTCPQWNRYVRLTKFEPKTILQESLQ